MSLKSLYKTVWEIKQRVIIDMAADRGAFIDQSQSLNVHMSDPNFGKLTSLHFYAWKVRSVIGGRARGGWVWKGGRLGSGAATWLSPVAACTGRGPGSPRLLC
jgi:hypothetical protein